MTGQEIRDFRESLNLKIGEFAERCGYSWSQIQRIETGRRNVPLRLVALINTFKGMKNGAKKKKQLGLSDV